MADSWYQRIDFKADDFDPDCLAGLMSIPEYAEARGCSVPAVYHRIRNQKISPFVVSVPTTEGKPLQLLKLQLLLEEGKRSDYARLVQLRQEEQIKIKNPPEPDPVNVEEANVTASSPEKNVQTPTDYLIYQTTGDDYTGRAFAVLERQIASYESKLARLEDYYNKEIEAREKAEAAREKAEEALRESEKHNREQASQLTELLAKSQELQARSQELQAQSHQLIAAAQERPQIAEHTADVQAEPASSEPAKEPEKKGFFARLFG